MMRMDWKCRCMDVEGFRGQNVHAYDTYNYDIVNVMIIWHGRRYRCGRYGHGRTTFSTERRAQPWYKPSVILGNGPVIKI